MNDSIADDWGTLRREVAIETDRTRADSRPVPKKVRAYTGRLYFPPELIPEGWQYAFMVERVMNEDQPENLQNRYEDGWRFVKASEHPELMIPHMEHYFSKGKDDGLIRRGGQILMKKPLDDYIATQVHWMNESIDRVTQAAYETDYTNNRSGPPRFKVENESSYGRMASRKN
jgi:hypothetical protein